MEKNDIWRQIHRNVVALISLMVALSTLVYSAWRNEETEDNWNQRTAAFEVLVKLNELQQIIFHHHYDKDTTGKGNPRAAWAYVLTVHDLSSVLNDPLPAEAENLLQVWGENWETLHSSSDSLQQVLTELDEMREATKELLRDLR
jgi:predicted helicase